MLGHGMGALVVNTLLGLNPWLADRLAGVIYSAPLFGTVHKFSPLQKVAILLKATFFDEAICMTEFPIHKLSRNKAYVR